MTNLKSNLRKVATIIACLTVVTMFASCGGKNPDDDDDGLNAHEKKLIGLWSFYGGPAPTGINRYYIFKKDGSFSFSRHVGTTTFFIEGKYTASSNKMHFKDFKWDGVSELTISEAVYEYEMGSDEKGVYLNISGILFDEPYVDISWAVKFRKD